MLSTKISNYSVFFILFGVFLPGIRVLGINFKIDFAIFLFCSVSIIFFKLGDFLKLNKFLLIPGLLFSIFIMLGIVSGVINNTFEMVSVRSFLYPILKGWIIVNFIILFYLKSFANNGFYLLNRMFVICLFIDGVFRLAEIIFPELKATWLNIITIDEWWNNTLGFRNLGLKGISIYDYAFASMICLLIDYSFRIKKSTNLIVYPVLFIFAFMSGRTSFMVLIAFLIIFMSSFKGRITVAISMFCVAILSVVIIDPSFLHNQELQWMFEPLFNLIEGKLETESTDDLLNNHLYFPENIFGYGVWSMAGDTVGNRFRGSDSGFILMIVYSGWIGFFLALYSAILISLQFLLSTGINQLEKKIFLFFLLAAMMVMVKGPIIFSEYVAVLCFIIISPIYFLRMKENNG